MTFTTLIIANFQTYSQRYMYSGIESKIPHTAGCLPQVCLPISARNHKKLLEMHMLNLASGFTGHEQLSKEEIRVSETLSSLSLGNIISVSFPDFHIAGRKRSYHVHISRLWMDYPKISN